MSRLEELTLCYQPQVSADGSNCRGRGLLRVLKPEPRLVSPADVLVFFKTPEAEEALDWWVLRRACADALQWPSLSVSVNVSAARFRDPAFAEGALALIDEVGVEPRRIEIEIAESAYIDDFDTALANIQILRAKASASSSTISAPAIQA